MRANRLLPLSPWLGLLGLLAATWLAYRPGLAGGYLFDDFVNLPALGAYGKVDDLPAFWRYVTSGSADPTGRPLALLSFLVDARDWPADPAPFLRSNVLLHLLNAGLLFALLRAMGRRLGDSGRRGDATALLGAGLWALHPLFVSTTLYIVQREAMLPATCVLLGLLAWLHGRTILADAPRAGTAWMVAGIAGGTLLGVASKANGALLPLLAWVLEATLFQSSVLQSTAPRAPLRPDARAARLRFWLLVLPSLALFAYLLAPLARWHAALDARPWTIGERVLTEPRVLFDYLRLLAVPRVLSTGLYNDGYRWSTGLLSPASTLPALLGLGALLAFALAWRRRTPALAAAILFFLAGHALESTSLPLELYFEHRNYLPALLLGWPLARAIGAWRTRRSLRVATALVLLGFLGATTWQRAALWADQPRMALLWAARNPDSSRAQATAAIFETRRGRAPEALARLGGAWHRHPEDLQLALNYLDAACVARGIRPQEAREAATALRTATGGDQLVHRWLEAALSVAASGRCPGLGLDEVAQWLDAAQANPRLASMPGRRQDLDSIAGQLALARGDAEGARRHFDAALDAWPTPQAAARQAGLLASHGAYAQALAHLDHYDAIRTRRVRPDGWGMPRLHDWVLERQGFWPRELDALRRTIRADMAAGATGGSP